MIKHICFDFDGVILDSVQIHLDTLREVFGLEYTREEYAFFLDGNFTDSEIGTLDWDKYHEALGPKYENTYFDSEIVAALTKLSLSYTLSINSTAGDEMLCQICKTNNVNHLFTQIWGSHVIRYKTDKFKKLITDHELSPGEIIFVTDTLGDIREANEVGVPTIAITGGYHDRDRLEQGSTIAIVDSWSELLGIIDGLNTK